MEDSRGIYIYTIDMGIAAKIKEHCIAELGMNIMPFVNVIDSDISEVIYEHTYEENNSEILKEDRPKDWYRKFENKRRW